MKTRHYLRPCFGSGVSLLVLTAVTGTVTLLLPAPTASAQSTDPRFQSPTYSQRRAATTTAPRESSFGQRLSNFFSSSNSARTTGSRQQVQSRVSNRQLPASTNYSAARSSTQYYTYAPDPAVTNSTYVPTYTPTQGSPQQMTLTNRAAGRNTVIYQAPRTNYGNTYQPGQDPRVLQPGESATVTADGTVYRTARRGETQYLEEGVTRSDGYALPSDAAAATQDATTGTQTAAREQPKPITPPKALIDKDSLPVAKWSATFGRVVSPFPPHHELDVSGLPPGSMARDPASGQIFRLP